MDVRNCLARVAKQPQRLTPCKPPRTREMTTAWLLRYGLIRMPAAHQQRKSGQLLCEPRSETGMARGAACFEVQIGEPMAGTGATVRQAHLPVLLGVMRPPSASGRSRVAGEGLWVKRAPPSKPDSLPTAMPAKEAGSTSKCRLLLLVALCATPAPGSHSPDCKGGVGTSAGHRPP